ncbi:helix-turn-helix domain-containing protein [Streptomyces sp. NPDC050560]|uniref:helix-turn-helix domain-containing protein n=1 Tax=Streptomyces sp. NPDC050560 TaxID=3365630 RepID=UPI0037A3C99F
MDSSERRRQFGAYLARLRRQARMTQPELADALCAATGTHSVTRSEVSRWERGVRVPGSWLSALAHVLGTPLADLDQAAAYGRGEDRAVLPGASAILAQLLPRDGGPLARAVVSTGRRLGAEDVESLAARVHALRLADDVLSGGDIVAPAFEELRRAVRLYREATFTDEVGRALLVQVGEVAQIAGWVASDAGRRKDAERAYRLGIDAARQADDKILVAHLAGSLAYQHTNNGRMHEGAELAQAAVDEAGPDVPPVARALFLDRVAWARTRVGESQGAMRALGEAHEALNSDGPESPRWAYWVSAAELDIMDARAYTELRRPLRAVPLLTDVLSRYDVTHARELALYRSWLAIALLDANEPEQAADEASRVLTASEALSSRRTAVRAQAVLDRMQPFRHVPEIREVLKDHAHLLLR